MADPGGAPSSAEQRAVIVKSRKIYFADADAETRAECQPLIDVVTQCVEALSTQLYGDEASLGHLGDRPHAENVRACTGATHAEVLFCRHGRLLQHDATWRHARPASRMD
jgi:hypothetical protein